MIFTPAQKGFVYTQEPYPLFVGGFGSGKTAAAIARIMRLKRMCPGQDVAYYLPTYGLIEDIAFKRFPALFEKNGLSYKLNKKAARFNTGIGDIIFRTMDNPDRIVGYEVAHSVCDELDTLPIDKARNTWNKVIARNRQKAYTVSGRPVRNSVCVATTPEGFRFAYERWVKNKAPGYEIFRAKTVDNIANLPDGYIENLQNTYSSSLLAAYLDGEFVNLTFGSVYGEFDRNLNDSREIIQAGDPLHIGMDFNVTRMAAVVFVLRNGDPHAVEEVIDAFDTPSMINIIKSRYQGHSIIIYPDASGQSRKSNNASVSDLSLLQSAGFIVRNNPVNPAVKDRVLSMNAMINANGVRRLKVNVDGCPVFLEGLEKQAYDKNGEPDKTTGLDHVCDAGGYFVAYKYPVAKRIATVHQLRI